MTLTEAIELFLGDQGSPNTARTYDCGLRRFMDWEYAERLKRDKKAKRIQRIEDFDPKRVIPFARALKREGLSFRTISSYLVALKQFLFWLKREEKSYVSAESLMDMAERITDWNTKNKANPLPRLPKEEAVLTALAGAGQAEGQTERMRLFHLRNAALLETLASTACRISEASSLKRADLVPDQWAAWVREGKGRKDRMIFFASEDSWNVVQTYLKQRDKLGYEVIGQEPVFARHDTVSHGRGQILPLCPNSMRWALNVLLKETGAAHFTPHQLRHRAATQFLRKSGNLELVKDYLGHENVETTSKIYTHLDNADLMNALRS